MAWVEVHITTTANQADEIGEQLTELGASALTTQDAGNQPVYEPALGSIPTWPETTIIGLFDAEQNLAPILHYLREQQTRGHILHFQQNALADEDWERRCLADFKPMQFGERLWICPTWETPPHPQAVNIILDPGLAFGTGTHATTALCLEWLETHIQPGSYIIDYGCGSGILGIAALKLGAQHVLAIDHDPQALEETQQNCDRNQITTQQLTTSLPGKTISAPVDLVIANILAQPLITLAPYLADLVKVQGQILLSGILAEQAEEVAQAYRPWFDMQPAEYKEEWVKLTGIRQ